MSVILWLVSITVVDAVFKKCDISWNSAIVVKWWLQNTWLSTTQLIKF